MQVHGAVNSTSGDNSLQPSKPRKVPLRRKARFVSELRTRHRGRRAGPIKLRPIPKSGGRGRGQIRSNRDPFGRGFDGAHQLAILRDALHGLESMQRDGESIDVP